MDCPNSECREGKVYESVEVYGNPTLVGKPCPICGGVGSVPVRDLVEAFAGEIA